MSEDELMVYPGAVLTVESRPLSRFNGPASVIRHSARHGRADVMRNSIIFWPEPGYLGPAEVIVHSATTEYQLWDQRTIQVVPMPEVLAGLEVSLRDPSGEAILRQAEPDARPMHLILRNPSQDAAFPLGDVAHYRIELHFRKGVVEEQPIAYMYSWGQATMTWTDATGTRYKTFEIGLRGAVAHGWTDGTGATLAFEILGECSEIPPGGTMSLDVPGLVATQFGAAWPTRVLARIQLVQKRPGIGHSISLMIERSQTLGARQGMQS